MHALTPSFFMLLGSVEVWSFDSVNHKYIRYKEGLLGCSYSTSSKSNAVDDVFMVHPKGFYKKQPISALQPFEIQEYSCTTAP